MSAFGPGSGYKTDWSKWAKHAAPRECEADGCSNTFQPNHPRRRF